MNIPININQFVNITPTRGELNQFGVNLKHLIFSFLAGSRMQFFSGGSITKSAAKPSLSIS